MKSLLLVSVQSILTFIIYEFSLSRMKEYTAFRGGAPTSYLHNYGSNIHTPRKRDAFIYIKNYKIIWGISKDNLLTNWTLKALIFFLFMKKHLVNINNNVIENYLWSKWCKRRRSEPIVLKYRYFTWVFKRWRGKDEYFTHKNNQWFTERISR